METVIENLKKAAEMIKTSEAQRKHLQQIIDRQKAIIQDYERAHGSHEQAIMTFAAIQAENCMDDNFDNFDIPL
jgi:predicted RNase H-like nuclease (RuvC/YqgF family)